MPQQAHTGRWHRTHEGTISSFLSAYRVAKVLKKRQKAAITAAFRPLFNKDCSNFSS